MKSNKVALMDTKDNTIGDMESCLPNDKVRGTGHFTNFKLFYLQYICALYKDRFPGLLSYNRFVELVKEGCHPHEVIPENALHW